MPEVRIHIAAEAATETLAAVQTWLNQHSRDATNCETYTTAGGGVVLKAKFDRDELARAFQQKFAPLSIAES